jgi:hypothetical protein
MKNVLISILVLGAIAAGIGYYMYNKPVASLEKKKADVEVTASRLVADYEADEKAADSLYLGKIVLVSGKVAAVTTEEGRNKIQIETDNPMSLVICELEGGGEAVTVKAGDEVNVKGLCSGYLSDVILVQSSIVK